MPFPQLFELVGLGGDIDLAGPLELAVDAVAGDGGLDGVEVPLLQYVWKCQVTSKPCSSEPVCTEVEAW
ncbi:hypothetical protein SFIMM107S_06854 [Streptomyces griseus]